MGSTVGNTVTPGQAASASRPGVWLTDLSLFLMALIWGVNFSVIKYGTGLIDPLAFNGARILEAAIALVLIAAIAGGEWPDRRTAIRLVLLGVLGNGLYQAFFVEGIARTRASDAALVVAASPALIALFGRMRGVERISRRGFGGIALSMAGIALVVLATAHGITGDASLFGDLLVLCGSACWAVYTVLLKPYTHRVGGLHLAALTMVGGAIPVVLFTGPAMVRAPWASLPPMGWVAIVYAGIFSLVIAYLFWYRGVRVLGPTRTAMYSNLQPVIAVLVAWAMLGETPTPWQLVGAVLIGGGLLLTRA